MGSFLVSLAVALIAGALGVGYSAVVTSKSVAVKRAINQLTRDITKAMSKNSALRNKIVDAYNHKDANMATAILQGEGFGARDAALREARAKLKAETEGQVDTLDRDNAQLAQKSANLANASMLAGSGTFTSTEAAKSIAKAEVGEDQYNKADEAVRQNVTGGQSNAKI